MTPQERLIVALDTPNERAAVTVVEALAPCVGGFKVGLELVNSAGIQVLSRLYRIGASRLFYDAKLHDIPNTVAGAVSSICAHPVWMVNVHAAGGRRMMEGAANALRASDITGKRPLLIAVTVLTSLDAVELEHELCVGLSPGQYAVHLAKMAQESGADGVVASAHEVKGIRAVCGTDFVVVTPGIRHAGTDQHDQRRTMTPAAAVAQGADYLVVGRAVTDAPDMAAAAQNMIAELDEAQCSV